MWASALKTYEDEATRYLYFPEKLAIASEEQIRQDLLKHRLALQPNKHVYIWRTIAHTFHEYYNDDPRKLIKEASSDAENLIGLLQSTHKARFPYLSGPKMSNYWPYILSIYTDAQFSRSEAISIIPDTHVIQSSFELGIAEKNATSIQVEVAWKKLLTGSGINPAQIHPVLWNWSRNNFKPGV